MVAMPENIATIIPTDAETRAYLDAFTDMGIGFGQPLTESVRAEQSGTTRLADVAA